MAHYEHYEASSDHVGAISFASAKDEAFAPEKTLQFNISRSEGLKGGCYALKATFRYSGEIELCDMMSSGPSFNELQSGGCKLGSRQ
jgi:hypothetical protein